MTDLPVPVIDSSRCDGALLCVEACPTGAIGVVDGKCRIVAPDRCEYCLACENICPADAISLPFLVVFSRAKQERS